MHGLIHLTMTLGGGDPCPSISVMKLITEADLESGIGPEFGGVGRKTMLESAMWPSQLLWETLTVTTRDITVSLVFVDSRLPVAWVSTWPGI